MASVLAKAEYLALRARLDLRARTWPTLLIVAIDALVLASSVYLLRAGSWWGYAAAQLLLALLFFNCFTLLHECAHDSATPFTWLNTIVGHLASVFCLLPYFPWKDIHTQHHAFTGSVDDDPSLKSLKTWRRNGVPAIARAAWLTWVPIAALLQHLVFAAYPLSQWRQGQLRGQRLLRSIFSLLFIPTAIVVLRALLPDVVRISVLWPALLLFHVMEELVNLPHHVDVSTFEAKRPVWEQHLATRSCYYAPGVSELLMLNFNFHTEHHFFPSLPWYRLRAARALLRPVLGDAYRESIGIRWNLDNRRVDLQQIVDRNRRPSSECRVVEVFDNG